MLELHWEKTSGDGWNTSGPLASPLRAAIAMATETFALSPGHWNFSATSSIPSRAGLGSSAALSVSVAKFFQQLHPKVDVFSLALKLENIFHGSSSGIDLAAVLSDGPILFRRGQAPEPVHMKWKPLLYLKDTGLRSSTKTCIEKVVSLGRPDLDERMEKAAIAMKLALTTKDALADLQYAVEEAALCFEEWGLVPVEVANKITSLKKSGALAVKPTGSGDGGFLLSLWKEPPTDESLIPIWDF